MAQTFVGIDIGFTKCVTVKGDGDIVLTETGGINRPSLVSFVGGARLVGEEAAAQASSSTTICLSHLLIGQSDLGALISNTLLRCLSPGLLQVDPAEPHVLCANVVYNSSPISIPITALLGMYLARQSARIETVTGSTGCKLAFVLPPQSSPSVVRAITEACVIAKIEQSRICFVNKIQAMLSAYRRKAATMVTATQAASPKLVLMCDVGASSTSLALIFDDGASVNPPTVVADAFVDVGAAHVDIALFDHFSRGAIPPDSKRGMRLLQGCERLKKLLSQLPEASTVVENMTDEGADMTLALKRAELAGLAAPQLSRLADAVRSVISKAQAQDPQGGAPAVQVVELLGGGSRLPAVQALLNELFPFAVLGARFDEASVAVGAALVAAAGISEAMGHESLPHAQEGQEEALLSPAASVGLSEQAVLDLTAQEEAWQHNDSQLTLLLQSRNAIESTLLKFRSLPALHPAQASLLPPGLGAYLDEQEEWLWSNPDADLDAVTAQRAALDSSLAQQCAAFLDAAEEAKRAKDGDAMNVELDASAGIGSEGGGLSEVDAKIADRSRLTTKNLAEATDLLASASTELQVRAALARFNKALGHCLSIPEQGLLGATGGPGAGTKRALGLTGSSSSSGASHEPQSAQQLVAWKEAIHLGLATCYHKLGNVDLAVAACSAAIQAQPSSVAAHRTRSELFVAKKEWERAADDAQVIVRLLSESGSGSGSGQGRAAKTSPPSPAGGDGADLALAKSWAAKLRDKAVEEKQKEKKGSGCAVM